MGTVNTNLDPFQALSNEERAFLRAVEVMNNSCERRVYILSANELVALLGGAKASQRRLEILSNVLAESLSCRKFVLTKCLDKSKSVLTNCLVKS